MHLSLHFLGTFNATLDGEAIIESRAKRIEALLIYLALEADRAHRRETLVGLLFPDMPDEKARNNLRQTLTRLRRAIHDKDSASPFLLVTREATQFNINSDHFLDVATLKNLLDGCELHSGQRDGHCPDCMRQAAEGVKLARGPLLEGFFLDNSPAFDEWLLIQRESTQQTMLEALQQLADYYESRGEYNTAFQYARRQLEFEPWREESHQQLMRLMAYQGQRNAAMQQYKKLADLLREELGVEPLPKTRDLLARISTTVENRPNRLPPRNPLFIGRESELAKINQFLVDKDRRLLTLAGIGGSGKTALAIEAGWRVATRYLGPFIHGVIFVSLAEVPATMDKENGQTDDDTLAGFNPLETAVAAALNFSFSGTVDPQKQLLHYLKDRSLLLILDNLEHLLDMGRTLLRDLMWQTAELKVMVTARERLAMREEWLLEISGLSYPDPGQAVSAQNLQQDYQAVGLFLQRARQLVPDFALVDNGNGSAATCSVSAVNRITHLLQGLPLGLELAASWVRLLSCEEIAAEIENSLDFLQSSLHDVPLRHQSLRAVFDYSWQLLTQEEQHVLQRLSVFSGTFDRQAAAAVVEASLPILGALVDCSLLQRRELPGSTSTTIRFELLVVLRQYTAEKLAMNLEAEEISVRNKHAHYFLGFLQERREALKGRRQLEAVAEIADDIGNIRAAWDWAIRQGEWASIEAALDSLALFYYMRSWFAEGAEMFYRAAASLAKDRFNKEMNRIRAKLLARQGWFVFLLGQQKEGQEYLLESVEILRQQEDHLALANSLNYLAAATTGLGDYQAARQFVEVGLSLGEINGDRNSVAISNNILSQIAYPLGDLSQSKHYCEVGLAIGQETGNRWSIGFSLTNLGRVSYALGNFPEAWNRFLESLTIREELGDARGQALCLRYLGNTALAQGEYRTAQEKYEASLAIFREIGNQIGIAATLNHLGYLSLALAEQARAQRYFLEALFIAHQVTAVPRMMEALIGLAPLYIDDMPQRALDIALLVEQHSASTGESRERAGDLLAEYGASLAADGEPFLSSKEDLVNLANLVTDLLSS
jgi:DNA-binding SARP family transcriptional activator/predicted ATPase